MIQQCIKLDVKTMEKGSGFQPYIKHQVITELKDLIELHTQSKLNAGKNNSGIIYLYSATLFMGTHAHSNDKNTVFVCFSFCQCNY